MTPKEQYNLIEKCYLTCKGRDVSCEYFATTKSYKGCYIYKTLLNDEIKLGKGLKNITYPVLEQILTKHNLMLNNDIQTQKTIQ